MQQPALSQLLHLQDKVDQEQVALGQGELVEAEINNEHASVHPEEQDR